MTLLSLGAQKTSPRFSPMSLADIVGHEEVVARIRARFERDQHSTALLLYGPEGIGKRTIARMYAKALLCETDRDDRSEPCRECHDCRAFDSRNHFDYLEIDARVVGGKEKLREWLRVAPIGGRHVLVIENIDDAPSEFIDALLKPLEAPDEERDSIAPTTPILIAEDLDGVRQAGRSRCSVERLRPLAPRAAKLLASRAADSALTEGLGEEALHSLVVGSRGLPGLISETIESVRQQEFIDAASIRTALDVDWADDAASYWLAVLTQPASDLVPDDVIYFGQSTARLRSIWTALDAFMAKTPVATVDEPALHFLDGALLGRLHKVLATRAHEQGLSTATLWKEIAALLLGEDFSDLDGHRYLISQISRLVRK